MQILETSQGFEITFPFDWKKVAAVKAIQGARYNGTFWIVPKQKENEIQQLMKKFHLVDAKTMTAPMEIKELPPLPDLEIDISLLREPYAFQKKGIAYGLKHKRIIIGDEPGLGKTGQSIGIITGANAFPCLVICPSSLKMNWQSEWQKWTGKRAMILNDRVKNTWHTYINVGMVDVIICNYESLRKYFVERINKTVDKNGKEMPMKLKDIVFRETVQNLLKSLIVDESHRCKDGSTQQTKFTMGIARGKEYVLELTGTPLVNKPKDLVAQLHIIDRLGDIVSHIPSNPYAKKPANYYTKFMDRYCEGGQGAANLKELNYRLNLCCFYRREKVDVLKDLPAKVRQVMHCEISTRAEYTKAENEFEKYLKEVKGCTDEDIKKKMRGEIMVKIGVLKNISARGKMQAVKDFVDELHESNQKIILFCHLKEVARGLKALYPHAVSVGGDDSSEQRNANVHAFQKCKQCGVRLEDHGGADHKHVLSDTLDIICSIMAAGVGLTLTASSRVGFVEFPWTDAACVQCEDRAHRISQVDSVQCIYFLGKDTIDEYCYELIQKKRAMAKMVTGDQNIIDDEIVDELLNLFSKPKAE